MFHAKSLSRLTSILALLIVLSTLGWSSKSRAQDYGKESRGSKAESLTLLLLTDGNIRGKSEDVILELAKKADKLIEEGRYSEAALIWEQILAWSDKYLGAENPSTAKSLNKLAWLYSRQGLYDKAETLYAKALSIHEKELGPQHLETAASLNNLAFIYARQGLLDKAETLYIRALVIRKKALGTQHPDTAISLNNLGGLYSEKGDYKKAEPLYVRALGINEKALGPSHPITANNLSNLALLYGNQGAYTKAIPLSIRALAIREKVLGARHRSTAASLNNLASLYMEIGSYDMAEPLITRAIAINESALGAHHPDTAVSLENLASLYAAQGRYSKAEPLYARSLVIKEVSLGPQHYKTATTLNELASIYSDLGNFDKAEKFYLRALAIREKTLGSQHPETANSLNNLALLYSQKGYYAKAEKLYTRALAIREKGLGLQHPDTAVSLNNLGGLYSEQGAYGKAEPFYVRALAIREKVLGIQHPDTAASLNNLGGLYSEQGAYGKAEPLYIRSLAIRKKVLGLRHPGTATILGNLAFLYSEQGDYVNAITYLREAFVSRLEATQREAPYLPVRERIDFLSSFSNSDTLPFSISNHGIINAKLALFTRLNRQGLLEAIEQRQTLLARLPGSKQMQQQLVEDLKALNIQLSSAVLKPEQRRALEIRQGQKEQQLYQLLPELKPRIVNVEQVAAALPSGSNLIEFQKYKPFNRRKPRNQRWGEPHYQALVLKPNGSVTAFHLGVATPIESLIHKALDASVQNNSDAVELWAQVSSRVLKPLLPALTDSRQWFISPDAELNRVPFAALPAPQSPSQSLAKAVHLRMLSSGHDLLRFQQPAKPAQAPVVFANPNFDRVVSSAIVVVAPSKDDQRQSRSLHLSAKTWKPLLASEREGQQVGALLAARRITGNDANTISLQQLIVPRVLHIASHGFFVGDSESKPNDPLGSLKDNSAMLSPFRAKDPLLQSGLVLAGANQPYADPNDDGYLTAAEAVGLQLDGTELVVLSACSTGQGSVSTGEGVYGLQRSLTVAGARSTMLSLWKVDDTATTEFMIRFYKRLKAGEARSDALAATQKEFRDGTAGGGQWKEPYYWAAWQLVGDWRPIQGL